MKYDISAFECVRCGNCCRGDGFVKVTRSDARRIAALLGITAQEFYHRYTMRHEGDYWLIDKPDNDDCIFLENNLCSVNEAKPQQCRDFPYKWRVSNMLSFCSAVRSALGITQPGNASHASQDNNDDMEQEL